jgi:hypothetical protein
MRTILTATLTPSISLLTRSFATLTAVSKIWWKILSPTLVGIKEG